MKLNYLLLRVIRHFLSDDLAHQLLHYGFIIKPGLESTAPRLAAERYLKVFAENDLELHGKKVLIFGYGGRYALGCELLDAGAASVWLLDKFAPPVNAENLDYARQNGRYLSISAEGQVEPASPRLRPIQADISELAESGFDLVLSSSVFEHLDQVQSITRQLAAITAPQGLHCHFIDLRDHYFKYPFEMLTFSKRTWKNWLNPGSNLNRFRCGDYQAVFRQYFEQVKMIVLSRDLDRFLAVKSRIKEEFLSGDDQVDSVTEICVIARDPRTPEKTV